MLNSFEKKKEFFDGCGVMLSICYDNEWSSSQKSFIDRLKLD